MIEQGERADAPAPHSPARAAEQAGAARWGATGGGSRLGATALSCTTASTHAQHCAWHRIGTGGGVLTWMGEYSRA